MNSDIQKIQLACQSLSDESKRLTHVLDDYSSLVSKIYKEAENSNSALAKRLLNLLDKFHEL